MKRNQSSEWFVFEKPYGEPGVIWKDGDEYHIERQVTSEGNIIWFGIGVNWKKEPGKPWGVLTVNDDARPLGKYFPEIVYGEDRMYFKECPMPIYEEKYVEFNSGSVTDMASAYADYFKTHVKSREDSTRFLLDAGILDELGNLTERYGDEKKPDAKKYASNFANYESEFYKKACDWLLPLGYVEIFTNHLCSKIREWHFIKDGIRVVCVKEQFDEHCYLHIDMISIRPCLSMRTGQYEMLTPQLDELHQHVLAESRKLKKPKKRWRIRK